VISVAACFAVLGMGALTLTLLTVSHQPQATGIGFSWRGLTELLTSSIVLGWVAGTAWYFTRR